jgi:hypothetical protein
MKYVCLGYIEPARFEGWSEGEREAVLDACFAYDGHLRANGHWVSGEALQPAETALTVRWKDGEAVTTDGPYAETKEQIGGVLVLEARDMNHAIQLISQHPGVKNGPFEIRPAADLSAMMQASVERRRSRGGD